MHWIHIGCAMFFMVSFVCQVNCSPSGYLDQQLANAQNAQYPNRQSTTGASEPDGLEMDVDNPYDWITHNKPEQHQVGNSFQHSKQQPITSDKSEAPWSNQKGDGDNKANVLKGQQYQKQTAEI